LKEDKNEFLAGVWADRELKIPFLKNDFENFLVFVEFLISPLFWDIYSLNTKFVEPESDKIHSLFQKSYNSK